MNHDEGGVEPHQDVSEAALLDGQTKQKFAGKLRTWLLRKSISHKFQNSQDEKAKFLHQRCVRERVKVIVFQLRGLSSCTWWNRSRIFLGRKKLSYLNVPEFYHG